MTSNFYSLLYWNLHSPGGQDPYTEQLCLWSNSGVIHMGHHDDYISLAMVTPGPLWQTNCPLHTALFTEEANFIPTSSAV